MISIGICGVNSNHAEPLASFHPSSPDYLLLLVKTDAFFEVGGEIRQTPPNTAILYQKGAYVRYGRPTPQYNDDWIHFDIDASDEGFLSSLEIPFNIPHHLYGFESLAEYARMVVSEKNSMKRHKREILDSLMRTMLYTLASNIHLHPDERLPHKHYEAMMELRNAIRSDPQLPWSIEAMAQRVHMSSSYYQHIYKQLFDISCMQEVIQARIKMARQLLRTSEAPVGHLAELCGYSNDLHFMRQFKKVEGVTPSQYRRLYRKE